MNFLKKNGMFDWLNIFILLEDSLLDNKYKFFHVADMKTMHRNHSGSF